MTALNDPQPAGRTNKTTQAPGDFRRRGTNGPPVVRSQTKTRKRQGKKADLLAAAEAEGIEVPTKVTVAQLHELLGPEPGDDVYSRPSSLGDALDSGGGLVRWKQRMLAKGMTMIDAPDLKEASGEQIDGVISDAMERAGAQLAADRGTHIHSLCERATRDRKIDDLLVEGEALGIPAALQHHIAEQWQAFRVANGLLAKAIEAHVINDEFRAAGSLDYIDLHDAGSSHVGDIKSGSLHEQYAVQLAVYAGSRFYDTEADERGEPIGVDQSLGFIYHYDLSAALDGEAVEWRLVPVDLEVGRAGARLAVACRDWPTTDPFAAPSDSPQAEVEQRPAGPDDRSEPAGNPEPVDPETERAALRELWATVQRSYEAGGRVGEWAQIVGAAGIGADSTNEQIAAVLEQLEPPFDDVAEPPAATGDDPVVAPPSLPTPTDDDEGGPADPSAVEALRRAAGELGDDASAWLGSIIGETRRSGRSIHMGEQATVRRFEAARGLVALAADGSTDGDLVRAICAHILDTDAAYHPIHQVGAVVGALTAAEAARFASLCDDIIAARTSLSWRDDRYVVAA